MSQQISVQWRSCNCGRHQPSALVSQYRLPPIICSTRPRLVCSRLQPARHYGALSPYFWSVVSCPQLEVLPNSYLNLGQRSDRICRLALGRPCRGPRPSRWSRSSAKFLTVAGDDDQAPLLVAAPGSTTSDMRQASKQTGFHPLDGANHLRAAGWPAIVCLLVAHHSGSRFVASERGLTTPWRISNSGKICRAMP